eukprot:2121459-Heterocapsa_arctica.AAC.1
MDEAVYQKTVDEASLGLINGPHSAHRRLQRARPQRHVGHPGEDDSGGLDNVVVLGKLWAKALKEGDETGQVIFRLESGEVLEGKLHRGHSKGQARKLLGRSLDLEKAFKQLARHPKHAAFTVIA